MEQRLALPANNINTGIRRKRAVAVLGNQKRPRYRYRELSQQGVERAINTVGRYDCKVCVNKDYASTKSLRNHQRIKHEEERHPGPTTYMG
jgi:hypothetical protein